MNTKDKRRMQDDKHFLNMLASLLNSVMTYERIVDDQHMRYVDNISDIYVDRIAEHLSILRQVVVDKIGEVSKMYP